MAGPSPQIPATLEVDKPEELLARYYPNGKLGGLTVDGRSPGNAGQHVELTVRVKKPAREFHVFGQLAWARRVGSKALPLAFGVDFLPEDDNSERLLAFARRELTAEVMRAQTRVQVQLPARVVHQGKVRNEILADVSPGGAFVRTWDPLALGEYVQLVVRPPGALLTMSLSGRVAWARKTGSHQGMGIEFLDPDGSQHQKVEKLVARVQARK